MQFEALEQNASGTPYGRLAGLFRGHALLKQGDGAGAATAYTQYLSTASAPDYLRQQALVGLGHAKELANDMTGAQDAYLQAEKLDGPATAEASLGVARMLDAQGQADLGDPQRSRGGFVVRRRHGLCGHRGHGVPPRGDRLGRT